MKKFLGIFCAIGLALASTACTPSKPVPQPAPSPTEQSATAPAAESPAESPSETPALEASEVPAQNNEPINVMALKGPTALGMLQLMERNKSDVSLNKYNFEIVGTADEIVAKLTSGQVDIAAVPANLAATLYNKTQGDIKVCAINTLGVLYVVDTTGSISSIEDLKGKTIYSVGKGTTPEFTLNHVLEKNGLASDVTVEYKAEATELAALLESGQAELALLPEPYVTSVLAQNPSVKIALSLTEEWDRIQPDFKMLTGTTVVSAKFAQENPDLLKSFMEEYKNSVEFISSASNIDTAAILAVEYGIIGNENVAKQSIPRCNIVFIDGNNMARDLEGYLGVLFQADPKSVGGSVPDEQFYYLGN